MPLLEIPASGIGAGPAADGQVLVYHDLLGIWNGRPAKFVRQYAQVREQMVEGASAYSHEVRNRTYPAAEHGYSMSPDEAAELRAWSAHLPKAHVAQQRD
jgi:3-methyl-2-oxobutanoate hydroxymethyltransferase